MRFHHLVIVAAWSLTGAVQAQDYTHYQGAWNGPFLLYVAQQDTGAQGESQVFPGRLLIEPNGMVHGIIPAAECKLEGSSTDFVSPANASIDLVASGCKDPRFDGHFTGKLIDNPVARYGSLRLSSMHSLDAGTVQISAVMHH